MTSQTQPEDWTKFVTLQPPNEVKFKLTQDDVPEPQNVQATDQAKAYDKIQIINNSKSSILFKVKTTSIKNYMVRPNADHIKPGGKVIVRIQTQTPINAKTLDLKKDRFLVQLTKLEEAPSQSISPEQIAKMWEKVDKHKLVQYKLKVDLAADVLQLMADKSSNDPQSQMQKSQASLMTAVQGEVVDQMIPDTRDRIEESKEKPEIKLGTFTQQKPAHRSSQMEDIKEQDSELDDQTFGKLSQQDIQQSSATKQNEPTRVGGGAAASPQPKADLGSKRKLEEAKAKKYELESLVQRTKNSQNLVRQKNMATGKSSSAAKTADGYMLYHLIIAMVIGVLVGAYVKTKFLSSEEPAGKVEL